MEVKMVSSAPHTRGWERPPRRAMRGAAGAGTGWVGQAGSSREGGPQAAELGRLHGGRRGGVLRVRPRGWVPVVPGWGDPQPCFI